MTKNRAGGLLFKANKILLIRRIKDSKEFWVIPGGGVEAGENFEEAIKREMFEEASVEVEIKEKALEFESTFVKGAKEVYFILSLVAGEPKLNLEGPEAIRMLQSNQENFYELIWVPLSEISNYLLYPEEVKQYLINYFK